MLSHLHPLPLISKSKTLNHANQIHAHFVTNGLLNSPSLSSQLILSLLRSPHPPLHILAHRLFFSNQYHSIDNNPSPSSSFLWNFIIKSFSNDPFRAILAFSLMIHNGVFADKFSFSLALKACSASSSFKEGSQIHSLVHKCTEFVSNNYLQNALVAFYCKCGRREIAQQVFDRIPERDSVSWNLMIDGYVKGGELGIARELYDEMRDEDRNLVTWNTMIGGYMSLGDGEIDVGRVLFDRMPQRDLISWNLMIDGYAKCRRMDEAVDLFNRMPHKDVISWANLIAGYMEVGNINEASKLFNEMPDKDVITWNIMMAGYIKNGRFVEALRLFNKMRAVGSNVVPDSTTIATALSAISKLGRLQDGISIHNYIKRNRLPLNEKLGVGLIDMYSKCGRLDEALRVFEISSGRNIDHWNAMIGGLAIHGYGELALKLFHEMERRSLKPDDITFIGILNACSHSALVKEGLTCFKVMRSEYKLKPKMQHYGCMVDILGRAGRLEEAWRLIMEMPFEPNDVIWKSLLSACKKHGQFEMGIKVAKLLTEEGSCTCSSSYILLSNIYAGIGMWRDARNVRMMIKERELMKIPGCSWIELDGVMHEFVVGDNSYPRAKEAYSLLEELCTFKLNSPHALCSIQQQTNITSESCCMNAH